MGESGYKSEVDEEERQVVFGVEMTRPQMALLRDQFMLTGMMLEKLPTTFRERMLNMPLLDLVSCNWHVNWRATNLSLVERSYRSLLN